MYCPKCATQLPDDQKFCRSCGFDLRGIVGLLSPDPEAVEIERFIPAPRDASKSQKKKFQLRGTITLMSALLVGCTIPICLGVLSHWPGLNQLILVLSGLAGMLLFGGIIMLVYSDSLPKTEPGKEASSPKPLPRSIPTNQLPPASQAEAIPGITEQTTGLLKTAKKTGSSGTL